MTFKFANFINFNFCFPSSLRFLLIHINRSKRQRRITWTSLDFDTESKKQNEWQLNLYSCSQLCFKLKLLLNEEKTILVNKIIYNFNLWIYYLVPIWSFRIFVVQNHYVHTYIEERKSSNNWQRILCNLKMICWSLSL